MDSPADGDELARVVPLRRRDRELTATPGARGSLPRERAPFDPEIEPGDTPSRRMSAPKDRAPRPHALRAPLGRRVPGSQDDRPAATSRRYSSRVLLTGAAGAGLATVAALALLARPQPVPALPGHAARVPGGSRDCGRARAHQAGGALGQRQPIRCHSATPPRRRPGGRSRSEPHRAPSEPDPDRGRLPPARHAVSRRPRAHQSAVVASYTPETSATSSARRCARNPKPPQSRTRRRRPSRRRRLNSRPALSSPARARLRPAIDQFLESRASSAQVHRRIPDPQRKERHDPPPRAAPSSKRHPVPRVRGRARARGRRRLRVRREQDQDDHGLRRQGHRRSPSQNHGKCKRGQTRVTWNQQGPQGAQGIQGPAGRAGSARGQRLGATSRMRARCSSGQGLSVQHVSAGTYQVTITAPACAHGSNAPVITVSDSNPPAGQAGGRVSGRVVRVDGQQPAVHGVHGRGRGRLVHADRPPVHGDGHLHVEGRWSHGR